MTLRILSYNILVGGEDRLPLITYLIQKQRADVVALLEANHLGHAELLAHQLKMELAFGEANSEYHLAWLSRSAPLRVKNHRLPIFEKTLLEIELLWEATPLALFATHLRAGRDPEHDSFRAQEMRAILDILRTRDDQPHLLVGDLNTVHPTDSPNISVLVAQASEERRQTGPSPRFPRQVIPLLLEAGYVDCYRALHPSAAGYTYPSSLPALRLDYLFASPLLATHLSACGVVREAEAKKASDHLPIWAEFR